MRSYEVQFPYARHRGTRGRIVLVRRDRLRKSPRSDSDSERPIDNDLFLRSERQSLPKDDRRRNHDIRLGLCKPPHRARLWRGDHYLRLRRFRLARLPDHRHSTTIYPFKWYSVASSTGSGATYATTTEYVFNGDTLLSTIDQQFASGVATGTAQTRYIHPDHLGSTNVVTNASGTVVQTLDYYPYGSPRINSGSNATNRQFIGQFTDNSGLSYLNARYYEGSRGQFLSKTQASWR